MKRFVPIVFSIAVAGLPAAADEFTDTLQSALKAYEAGDVRGAQQDLDYAGKLLTSMKSTSLGKFLPEAPAGWTKEEASESDAGGFLGMLGGGVTAASTYRKDAQSFTITLVADSPMVSGLGAMITGMAGAAGGKPLRIQRTEFTESDDGLQGVVNGKVMVSVTGDASLDDKKAALDTMDFSGLGDF